MSTEYLTIAPHLADRCEALLPNDLLAAISELLADPGASGMGTEYLCWDALSQIAEQGMKGIKDSLLEQGITTHTDAGVFFQRRDETKPVTKVRDHIVTKYVPADEYPHLYKPDPTRLRKAYPPDTNPEFYEEGARRPARIDVTLPKIADDC